MITFEHVSLRYPNGLVALHDVSLHVAAGSFHFITGSSGAGKSSLLKLLALAERPQMGRMTLFGVEASRLPRATLPQLRRKIGLVYQDFQLLPHLTVAENIALPLKVIGESERLRAQKTSELLQWIGLSDYAASLPDVLSGGQKQMVAVARAVIATPELLLADEPTGNLDFDTSVKIIRLFEVMHRSGTTVVVATHDEHLIRQFSYPAWRLEGGRVV